MNFICKVNEPAVLLWTLMNMEIECVTPESVLEISTLGSEGKLHEKHSHLYIAYSKGEFGIYTSLALAKEWVVSTNAESCAILDNVDFALRALGVKKTEKEQRKEITRIISKQKQEKDMANDKKIGEFEEFLSLLKSAVKGKGGIIEEMISKIDSEISEISEKVKKNNCESVKCSFEDSLLPGNIIKFDSEKVAYGVILPGRVVLGIGGNGKVTGYLKKFTENEPFKVIGVYQPSKDAYLFSKTDKMVSVWEAEEPTEKVVHSKEEIENLLGLKPGSLEIK